MSNGTRAPLPTVLYELGDARVKTWENVVQLGFPRPRERNHRQVSRVGQLLSRQEFTYEQRGSQGKCNSRKSSHCLPGRQSISQRYTVNHGKIAAFAPMSSARVSAVITANVDRPTGQRIPEIAPKWVLEVGHILAIDSSRK